MNPSVVAAAASYRDGSESYPSKRMKLTTTATLAACNHRDWPGLPWNIVSSITDRLDIDDHVRFGAVCTSWRSIFLEQNENKKSPPFLLVAPPPEEADRHRRAVYSLSKNQVCSFRLQVPPHKVCRGSSFGWLVTLETKRRHQCQIQLLNPFLNRIVDLPPPDNIIAQQHPEGGWDGYYLRKAVLSCDPCSGDDFVVMAIMSRYAGLAFYKPGDPNWTSIGNDRATKVVDVIFSKNTNQFYALRITGQVIAIDLLGDEGCNGNNPKLTQIATGRFPKPFEPFRGLPSYLVEDLPSGGLFVVYKKLESSTPVEEMLVAVLNGEEAEAVESRDTKTVEFTVFKLNPSNGILTQIDNLAENIMFLGSNGSILRSAADCPGCEPGCIYYTDDFDITFRRNFDSYGLPYDGLYDLKDGSVRPHYSSPRYAGVGRPKALPLFDLVLPSPEEVLPQSIWLEPTLNRCN